MTEYLLPICMISIFLNVALYLRYAHEKFMKQMYFDMLETYRDDLKFYRRLAKTYKDLLGFNKE